MLESPPAVFPGLANSALGPETTSSNYATRHRRQRHGKGAAGEAASLFHIGSDALCAVLSPRSTDLFNAAVASINARRDALSAATDATTTKTMKTMKSSMNARRQLAALKDSPGPGHRHQKCLACHTMVDSRESGAMGAHMRDCPSFRSLVDLKWEAAVLGANRGEPLGLGRRMRIDAFDADHI
jgi:hypothetical protein